MRRIFKPCAHRDQPLHNMHRLFSIMSLCCPQPRYQTHSQVEQQSRMEAMFSTFTSTTRAIPNCMPQSLQTTPETILCPHQHLIMWRTLWKVRSHERLTTLHPLCMCDFVSSACTQLVQYTCSAWTQCGHAWSFWFCYTAGGSAGLVATA